MTAAQLRRPAHDDAMRIAEKQIGAHGAELFEREQPQFIHPIVHEGFAFGLRREDGHEADHIAWKAWP